MALLIVLLLLVLLFAGVGFALHLLWIVAAVLLVVWLVSLVTGAGRRGKTRAQR